MSSQSAVKGYKGKFEPDIKAMEKYTKPVLLVIDEGLLLKQTGNERFVYLKYRREITNNVKK